MCTFRLGQDRVFCLPTICFTTINLTAVAWSRESLRTCMDRRRSRSPRVTELFQRFVRIRKEDRSGASFRRRYRSACLKLLSYFLRLIDSLIGHPDFDPYHPSNQPVLRRRQQAKQRIDSIEAWNLPWRNEPLLPHLPVVAPRDPGYNSQSEDSLVAETLIITSESEAEPEAPVRPQGVWLTGRYARVQVTSNNSLLRRGPRPSSILAVERPSEPVNPPSRVGGCSSSSRTAVPRSISVEDNVVRLPWGTSVYPPITQQITSLNILSIDWHQVLDCIRIPGETVTRPVGYTVVEQVRAKLRELKSTVPGIHVVINSYCCAAGFRNGVLSIRCPEVDHVIVTSKKSGPRGKLAALQSVCRRTARICHIDDSAEVLRELKLERRKQRGWNTYPLGIRIPRSARRTAQEREPGVIYYGNVLETITHFVTSIHIE